jgi:superfamily II DNA/RNA helicase
VSSPTFAELGVRAETVAALDSVGITHAFRIQELALPIALTGQDIIGQAKTGTGKTLGFGIPVLEKVITPDEAGDAPFNGKPQALIVVPTRELAIQVAGDLKQAGSTRNVRVLTVYGGRAYEPQVEALRKGIEVVVGTPGRLIDLAKQGHLDLGFVKVLVLDEADEMLDMGFLPDVERMVAMIPSNRQTMLFSATMPGTIVNLARRYMTQPTHIRAVEASDDNVTVDAIEQHAWRTHAMDKPELLGRILQANGRGLTIVFSRTKRQAQRVADELSERGFAAAAVHGDLGQGAREQALRAFRNGKVDILVATDVAARGIDVEAVTHVINYECPDDEKTYLHRIGRTGRAGASGVAVTFVDWADTVRWQTINKALGLAFNDPVETYSSSPHVFTGLGIPEGTKGRLPHAQQTRAGLAAEEVEDLGETGKKHKSGGKPASKSHSDRPRGEKPQGDRPRSDKPRSEKSHSDKPRSDKPRSDKPKTDQPKGEGTGANTSAPRARRRTRGGGGDKAEQS